MTLEVARFIADWKAAVASRDLGQLARLLREDAVFRSPAVYKPYRGRQAVLFILSHVTELFGDLTYVASYANDAGGVVLEFSTTLQASGKTLELSGVDIFKLDSEGLVQDMTVMIRPLRGLQSLAAAMEERLSSAL